MTPSVATAPATASIPFGLIGAFAFGVFSILSYAFSGPSQKATNDTNEATETNNVQPSTPSTPGPSRPVSSDDTKTGRKKARRKSSNRYDDDSSSKIDSEFTHDVARHIVTRLRRWFRFGGLLQRISHDTSIPIDSIVARGATVYQDRTSGQGNAVHAAHLVRAGEIDGTLRQLSSSHFVGLRDFIGHTENVVWWANVGGVGRAIDEFQTNSANLDRLGRIDFSRSDLTAAELGELKELVKKYLEMLRSSANSTQNEHLRDAINDAIEIIQQTLVAEFYRAGKKGYDAQYSSWKQNQ